MAGERVIEARSASCAVGSLVPQNKCRLAFFNTRIHPYFDIYNRKRSDSVAYPDIFWYNVTRIHQVTTYTISKHTTHVR